MTESQHALKDAKRVTVFGGLLILAVMTAWLVAWNQGNYQMGRASGYEARFNEARAYNCRHLAYLLVNVSDPRFIQFSAIEAEYWYCYNGTIPGSDK